MSWQDILDEIAERRRLALAQGGEEGVRRQHEKGRLTVRERIETVLDAGSFAETGPIAGGSERNEDGSLESFTPGNFVLGFGRIDGREVVVGGEDFTMQGGSPNVAGLRKSVYAEQMAVHYRMPLVRLHEGGGGSVAGSSGRESKQRPTGDPVFAAPRFASVAEALATVPVASAALGPVAGLPASRLVASHFCVMARETAQVLTAGPAVVERALGEKLTKEELGGADVHARSGVVDNVAATEADALAQIRTFLSFMPRNVWELPPRREPGDDPGRREESLATIVPRSRRQAYDMRRIISLVVDDGEVFETGREFGRGIITCLARLNGWPVGILSNDCRFYAGSMTADGAQKAKRFIEMCETFKLPVVSLVDEPGFMIGLEAEQAGTIRYGTAAVLAAASCRVPWASVIVRRVFGVAGAAHFGPDAYVLSWPSAEVGAVPVEGGVAVAFAREIAQAPDPEARRRELEERMAAQLTPFPRAEALAVHDLIDPRETRPLLCAWIERVAVRLEELKGPVRFPYRP
jgi:acetyl-CoA carboxylase carboxyltransferase component